MMSKTSEIKMINFNGVWREFMKCIVCGNDVILDLEHHKVVRDNTTVGLASNFGSKEEPQLYDAFDCPTCGCQIIIGERKREVAEVHFIDTEEDIEDNDEESMAEESKPDNGANSSPEPDYEREDILKKIKEAGEE